jgi:hypothetical protein
MMIVIVLLYRYCNSYDNNPIFHNIYSRMSRLVGFDTTRLLTRQVDALAGYWTTQVYIVEKAGILYKFLNASELPGWNQQSMVAIATDQKLQNKKDVLAR